MDSNLASAPILFDRALLRARLDRARRGGPATFRLDRVRGLALDDATIWQDWQQSAFFK
jgi:hypothetical protein